MPGRSLLSPAARFFCAAQEETVWECLTVTTAYKMGGNMDNSEEYIQRLESGMRRWRNAACASGLLLLVIGVMGARSASTPMSLSRTDARRLDTLERQVKEFETWRSAHSNNYATFTSQTLDLVRERTAGVDDLRNKIDNIKIQGYPSPDALTRAFKRHSYTLDRHSKTLDSHRDAINDHQKHILYIYNKHLGARRHPRVRGVQ